MRLVDNFGVLIMMQALGFSLVLLAVCQVWAGIGIRSS